MSTIDDFLEHACEYSSEEEKEDYHEKPKALPIFLDPPRSVVN